MLHFPLKHVTTSNAKSIFSYLFLFTGFAFPFQTFLDIICMRFVPLLYYLHAKYFFGRRVGYYIIYPYTVE